MATRSSRVFLGRMQRGLGIEAGHTTVCGSILGSSNCTMKLNELKVSLAKQILESESESELHSVDLVLNQAVNFELSAEQKAQLDASHSRYLRGEGKSYTSAQMLRKVHNT